MKLIHLDLDGKQISSEDIPDKPTPPGTARGKDGQLYKFKDDPRRTTNDSVATETLVTAILDEPSDDTTQVITSFGKATQIVNIDFRIPRHKFFQGTSYRESTLFLTHEHMKDVRFLHNFGLNCIHTDINYLWVMLDKDGTVKLFTSHNKPAVIINNFLEAK